MTPRTVVAVAFFAIGCTLGCNPPTDIGTLCTMPNPDGGPGLWTQTSKSDDLFYQGTAQCQNEVCIRPAGANLAPGYGYCSNDCTPSEGTQNDPVANSPSPDCQGGVADIDGGSVAMVCRAVALDESFIQTILAEDGGAALLEQYLGGTTAPILCTTPEAQ